MILKKAYRYLLATKDYWYDLKCFLDNSMVLDRTSTEERYLSCITLRAHVVEKGLTMPEMRPNFGQANLKELIDYCIGYAKKYDTNKPLYTSAISVIKEYRQVHEALGVEWPDDINEAIGRIEELFPDTKIDSQLFVSKEGMFYRGNFEYIAHNRHTCRNFSGKVDEDSLKKAVELSQTAPSACNRQPCHVYVVNKGETFDKILTVQHGNRGFGDKADKFLIVTATMETYNGINERHGMYVDGGIYTMNLLYSLQYYGISACTLNCYMSGKEEWEMKSYIGTQDALVSIIAIGDCGEHVKIARSVRRDTKEILHIID